MERVAVFFAKRWVRGMGLEGSMVRMLARAAFVLAFSYNPCGNVTVAEKIIYIRRHAISAFISAT